LGKVCSQLRHAVGDHDVFPAYRHPAPGGSGAAGARLPLRKPGQHAATSPASSGAGQEFPSPCRQDCRTGNATPRSYARARRIGAEKDSCYRGAGAESIIGGQKRDFAGFKAGNPAAAGQDKRVLYRKLGDANHGGSPAESSNWRLRRSQWRARVRDSRPSGHDRAGGLFRYAVGPRLRQRHGRFPRRSWRYRQHRFWQRRCYWHQFRPGFRFARRGSPRGLRRRRYRSRGAIQAQVCRPHRQDFAG